MKRLVSAVVLSALLFVLAGCGQPVDGGLLIRTADPALSIFVPVPPAPIDAPDIVPSEPIAEEEEGQTNCNIAGNINAAGEKIYHLPTGIYWSRVRIDLDRGEEWLCSEDEAIAKGYRKSER